MLMMKVLYIIRRLFCEKGKYKKTHVVWKNGVTQIDDAIKEAMGWLEKEDRGELQVSVKVDPSKPSQDRMTRFYDFEFF